MTPFTDVFLYARDGCPACDVMKSKLDNAGIRYHVITDFNPEDLLDDDGRKIEMLPVLSVDGQLMRISQANQWIRKAMCI